MAVYFDGLFSYVQSMNDYYALTSYGFGGKVSGSSGDDETSSSRTGDGGFFTNIFNAVKDWLTSDDDEDGGQSESVWEGVDYGSRDALVEATTPKPGDYAHNQGQIDYAFEGITVTADRPIAEIPVWLEVGSSAQFGGSITNATKGGILAATGAHKLTSPWYVGASFSRYVIWSGRAGAGFGVLLSGATLVNEANQVGLYNVDMMTWADFGVSSGILVGVIVFNPIGGTIVCVAGSAYFMYRMLDENNKGVPNVRKD